MMMSTPLVKKMNEYKRSDISDFYVMYQENKARVLKVKSDVKATKAPVLLIPAMINRYYILDISKTNSLAKELSEDGHDVFVVDWGEAGPEDRWETFTDIFLGRLKRIVTKVTRDAGEKPVLFGYCMGGTMSVIYASIFPDDIKGLIGLTVPINFHEAGVMAKWTSKKYLNPANLVDAMGNVPPDMTQNGFVSLKPSKWMKKWETAWRRQEDDKFMDSFLTLENWVNDNIPFPGGIWQEYITWLYQENRLYNDTLYVGKYKASLKNISCPLLTIVANEDHIVPRESADPLHELAGTSDKTIKHFAGGHVGIVSSSKLFPQLSSTVKSWLDEKIG